MTSGSDHDPRVGTNKATLRRMLLGPFPATHKRMELNIIGMHRFDHGRVAETWTSWDDVAALNQLGLLPGP